MKIYPVVVHKSANEWVERKSQPVDKVREEYNPLVGFQSRDDLSPNSFLNISTFIVVCEAFLHILPHFGLWLKIFNVKPKVVSGEHAECGGAMVSKMPNVTWPTGTFNDSVKEWQQ